MSDFRTIFPKIPSENKISHKDALFLIGSCFSTNISEYLNKSGFNIQNNPLGTVFNPSSIKIMLEQFLDNKKITATELFQNQGLWRSFIFHSSMASPDKDDCIAKTNLAIQNANEFLKNANTLFITFGTAWVYEEVKSKNIVTNCHKLPANNFTKRMLSVNKIVTDYQSLIKKLQDLNSNLNIVFTVSPVRHLADGFTENSISKATLQVAIQTIIKENKNCIYFPSYEIVLDDLRDYRFFTEDMLHTNEQANAYVWKYFCDTYFTDQTNTHANKFLALEQMLAHRFLHKDVAAIDDFIKSGIKKAEELKAVNAIKANEYSARFEEKRNNTLI